MNKPALVLYHANCWDGFCAAWVARKVLGEENVTYHPYNYGEPRLDWTGFDVFVLDFSFPRAELLKGKEEANSVLVLDHHKSVAEALAGLDFCRFEKDKSGGRMAWEYFFPDRPAPWLVDFTEDRDLWRHALPNSKAVNAALRSYPMDFKLADKWEESDAVLVDLNVEGNAILRRERQIIDEHIARSIEVTLCSGGSNYKARIVNATTLYSEIAGELAEGFDLGACYYNRKDGTQVYSLRSSPEGIDVSEFAKHQGGGGHKHAAGFEWPYGEWCAFVGKTPGRKNV